MEVHYHPYITNWLLRNPEVHCRPYIRLSSIPILSKIYPVSTKTTYLLQIHFNITSPLQSVKILSMTSLGREVKPWVRAVDLRQVKEPQVEIRASEQNLSAFSSSL